MKNINNIAVCVLLVITNNLHANQFPNLIPVAAVTHTYQDGTGNHTVHYEAHPQGTCKNLQYLRNLQRLRAGAGITGAAVGAVATLALLGLGVGAYGFQGYPDGQEMDALAPAAISGALTIASGIYGARSLSRVRAISQMLNRHNPNPPFSVKSLSNPALKNGSFEWYPKSQQTTPIQAHVQK